MKRVFSVCALLICVGVLSACGGGGGSAGPDISGPPPPPTVDPASTTTVAGRISSIPSVKLGQFADGATGERFTDSQQQLFVGLMNNANLKTILETNNYTVVGTPETGTSNGVSYQQISAKQQTDSADLTIYVNGLYLTNSETVSVVLVDSATYGTAILAAGDPPSTLPSQSVTYSGNASIVEIAPQSSGDPRIEAEGGTFSLAINLGATSPVGTVSTSGFSTFQFASSSVELDKSTGSLSSNSVSIGRIAGTQQSGLLIGSLFGSDAEGAAGVIRSSSNTPATYVGTFFGKR